MYTNKAPEIKSKLNLLMAKLRTSFQNRGNRLMEMMRQSNHATGQKHYALTLDTHRAPIGTLPEGQLLNARADVPQLR